ncbi:MAG: hypothetical protein C5B52_15075 [Bacteroidetes bacterium]|nr:MAG: hypothetical protein C5B52_15075 [Bacteroidota bacterium]
MNHIDHHIDDLFRDNLESHEEAPNPSTWRSIENYLNEKDARQYRRKYQILANSTRRALMVLALLLIVSITKWNWESHTISRNVPNANSNRLEPNNNSRGLFLGVGSSEKITSPDEEMARSGIDHSNSLSGMAIPEDQDAFRFSQQKIENLDEPGTHGTNFTDNSILVSGKPIQIESWRLAFLMERDQVPHPQGMTKVSSNGHRFTLIPYFTFDHNTGRFEEVYEFHDQNKNELLERENPDISTTVGLHAEFRLNRRISFESGFSISNSYTSIAPTVIKAYQDSYGTYKFKLATSYGVAELKKTGITNPQYGDSIILNDAEQHLQYFSIPALVKYHLIPGRFNLSLSAGVAFNKIVNDKMEVNYSAGGNKEKETIEKIEGLNESFLSVNSGAEFTYDIGKRISVGINPGLRISITPVNSGTPVRTYPVSWGLGTLVKIRL